MTVRLITTGRGVLLVCDRCGSRWAQPRVQWARQDARTHLCPRRRVLEVR